MTPTQREAALRLANALLSLQGRKSSKSACEAAALLRELAQEPQAKPVDGYGNPLSGDRIINCCFPDCGCDGARLCMAEKGASSSACAINIERGSFGA